MRFRRPLLLAIVGSICAFGLSVSAETGLGTDPALFNKTLDAAIFRADKAFLTSIIPDDFRFSTLVNGGTVWTKEQWLGYMGGVKYMSREIVKEQIERHDNVVIATATIHYQYTTGKPTEIVQQRVYQQRAQGWMLVAHRTLKEEPIGATTSR